MKIRPIYFHLFLSTASAYVVQTPGNHELPQLPKKNDIGVAPTTKNLETVASQGMLGGTDDMMRRLNLGSNYAAAAVSSDEVVDEIEELNTIKLQDENEKYDSEIVASKEELVEELQKQIKPTLDVVVEDVEESPKARIDEPAKKVVVKLKIVEDEPEEDEAAEPEMKTKAEAEKHLIVTGWDEDEAEERAIAALEEQEEVVPVEAFEERLPYSPDSREQLFEFSAVDDFSAKFDEKLSRRMVSSNRFHADGRSVNPRPAFVARADYPKAQPANEATSATGNEEPAIISHHSHPSRNVAGMNSFVYNEAQEIPVLRFNYRGEIVEDDAPEETETEAAPALVEESKAPEVEAEVALEESKAPEATPADEIKEEGESAMEQVQDAVALQHAPRQAPAGRVGYLSTQYSFENWFDSKSKVTAAIFGQQEAKEYVPVEEIASEPSPVKPVETVSDLMETDPDLQDKIRQAARGESGYFSNRYSYDNWHENPQSNNIFLRETHIE